MTTPGDYLFPIGVAMLLALYFSRSATSTAARLIRVLGTAVLVYHGLAAAGAVEINRNEYTPAVANLHRTLEQAQQFFYTLIYLAILWFTPASAVLAAVAAPLLKLAGLILLLPLRLLGLHRLPISSVSVARPASPQRSTQDPQEAAVAEFARQMQAMAIRKRFNQGGGQPGNQAQSSQPLFKSAPVRRKPPAARQQLAPNQPTLASQRLGASQPAIPAEALQAYEWKVGDTIMGLYAVRQIHAGGGMGIVYRVYHGEWKLEMAMKCPRQELFGSEAQKELFMHECETWANLRLHPHIVSCHYILKLNGVPRIFAEYVDGGSLRDWIDSGKLYAGEADRVLRRMLDVAIQMAWGLLYAHEQGLIHQDVKPANVMITQDGTAKITDFGLAKARSVAGISATGGSQKSILVSCGGMTPAYCSPEQANGEPLGRQTDIWSWAASVLEMFTGEITWASGAVAGQALEAMLSGQVDPAWKVPLPAGLAGLLVDCLQRNPRQRPGDFGPIIKRLRETYRSCLKEDYLYPDPKEGVMQPDALNNRAVFWLEQGKTQAALQLLNEALTQQPNHLECVFNQGLIVWREKRDHFKQFRSALLKDQTPDNAARIQYLLGCVSLEQGDLKGAKAALKQSVTHGSAQGEAAALLEELTRLETMGRPLDGYRSPWLVARPESHACMAQKQAHEQFQAIMRQAAELLNAGRILDAKKLGIRAFGLANRKQQAEAMAFQKQVSADAFALAMQQARQHLEAGEWIKAEAAARQALAVNGREKDSGALALLDQILSRAFAAHLAQAEAARAAHQWDEAERAVRRARLVSGYQNDRRACDFWRSTPIQARFDFWLAKANGLFAAKDVEGAATALGRAQEFAGYTHDPAALELAAKIQFCRHLEQARELLQAGKFDGAEWLARQAQQCAGQENNPEARELLQAIRKAQYDHWLAQATSQYAAMDWQQADCAIQKCLAVASCEHGQAAADLQRRIRFGLFLHWMDQAVCRQREAKWLAAEEAVLQALKIPGFEKDAKALEVLENIRCPQSK